MFAPNQEKAASELVRVCRAGGRIGLANWTHDGFAGQLFKTFGKYLPPPAGVKSPALWGTQAGLDHLFQGHSMQATHQQINFRYKSAAHWLEISKAYFGPTNRAFAALDAGKQDELQADLTDLLGRMNRGGQDTLIVPSEYLEVVVTKRSLRQQQTGIARAEFALWTEDCHRTTAPFGDGPAATALCHCVGACLCSMTNPDFNMRRGKPIAHFGCERLQAREADI
jgi:hypothetical protein